MIFNLVSLDGISPAFCVYLLHDLQPSRDQPSMLIFYLLCYAPVLKIFIHYAQYYAHVKRLVLKI